MILSGSIDDSGGSGCQPDVRIQDVHITSFDQQSDRVPVFWLRNKGCARGALSAVWHRAPDHLVVKIDGSLVKQRRSWVR